MKEDKEAPSQLRRRAEDAVAGRSEDDRGLSAGETRRLIHELQVHQVELEMQNEELRRAQAELEAARDRYSDLYDFAPVGYVTISEKGIILEANLTAAALLSIERGRLVGNPLSRFVSKEGQDAFYLHCRQVFETGDRQICEVRMMKQDGTGFHAQLESMAVRDSDGNFTRYRTVISDITERKQVERELVRLERLRALGEMSAGVSHNLNNILTGVLGPAQLLQRITDDPAVLQEAEDIVKSTMRARDLVHSLHLSTRGMEEEALHPVRVNDAVREAVQAARPRWKDEAEAKGIAIEVVTDLGDVPPIRGTESRLHDILINLLFNAVDAMPEGGAVTICTRPVEEGVLLMFRDTGIGMDEETRRRVFEPFFTTKMDVGSGLGLSTAYGAVTHWGGAIDVESAPGEGTAFTIRLPAWTGPDVLGGADVEVRRVRRGKLLIVEDDAGVCNLLSRLLGRCHEVASVRNGQEALEVFAPGRYDVVLIDLGMPGMSGDRVAREMHRADPLVASVLITGWEIGEDDPRVSAFDFRIQKPFDDLDEVEDVVVRAVELHDRRTR